MGPRQDAQAALFYEFTLEDHVPQDHLLRSIDRFVDLFDICQYLAEFYSHTSHHSIDTLIKINSGDCSADQINGITWRGNGVHARFMQPINRGSTNSYN